MGRLTARKIRVGDLIRLTSDSVALKSAYTDYMHTCLLTDFRRFSDINESQIASQFFLVVENCYEEHGRGEGYTCFKVLGQVYIRSSSGRYSLSPPIVMLLSDVYIPNFRRARTLTLKQRS